ncbi:MAG: dTMP kinase [Deltaproteobacteria bacterium]|nr:dTMP kinase [Deltaproteobacteria bacterium]
MKGLFITFEGIEGCGKSTQISLLNDTLLSKGLPVVLTREPGGTQIGEKIRGLLLDVGSKGMSATTELLLYAAARAQHVAEIIRPALKAGKIVLCDRYFDSTAAYQGAARTLDENILKKLHEIATGNCLPDITFLLDCSVKTGFERIHNQRGKDQFDRLELESKNFHERVRTGYLALAKQEPDRIKIIDATRDIQEIHGQIKNITAKVSLRGA